MDEESEASVTRSMGEEHADVILLFLFLVSK